MESVKLEDVKNFDPDTVLDGTVDTSEPEPEEVPSNLKESLLATVQNEGIGELENMIRERLNNISEQKTARDGINSQVKADLDFLETKGLNKKAVKFAMTYLGLNEDQRLAFDLTYKIVRTAMGEPLQVEMDI